MIGDKRYWGKGYGSEAISIMAHICYDKLQLRKITAGCYSNNTGMIKAFLNNGFKIEGVLKNQLKYKKKYVDHILFGCFIEDLVEKNSQLNTGNASIKSLRLKNRIVFTCEYAMIIDLDQEL